MALDLEQLKERFESKFSKLKDDEKNSPVYRIEQINTFYSWNDIHRDIKNNSKAVLGVLRALNNAKRI